MSYLSRRGRGVLVAFEGCDRSGKSTQSKMLVDYLMSTGRDVAHFRFPDRSTAIGQSINSYLQGKSELEDHAVHLLFSANRWEAVYRPFPYFYVSQEIEAEWNTKKFKKFNISPKIKQLIEKGTFVIMDRYAFSGVAFTAAKGFDVTWCKNPDRGLPCPDIVFYLEISVKDAMLRASFGDERYENLEFQQHVAKVYHHLKSDDWKVVDALKDTNEIHKEIRSTVLKLEENVKHNKLKDLWTDKK